MTQQRSLKASFHAISCNSERWLTHMLAGVHVSPHPADPPLSESKVVRRGAV